MFSCQQNSSEEYSWAWNWLISLAVHRNAQRQSGFLCSPLFLEPQLCILCRIWQLPAPSPDCSPPPKHLLWLWRLMHWPKHWPSRLPSLARADLLYAASVNRPSGLMISQHRLCHQITVCKRIHHRQMVSHLLLQNCLLSRSQSSWLLKPEYESVLWTVFIFLHSIVICMHIYITFSWPLWVCPSCLFACAVSISSDSMHPFWLVGYVAQW